MGLMPPPRAGKAWYADIAKQYADWGVDYVKCDDIANLQRGTNRYPRAEVEALANGLRAGGRSIVLSLSPGPALVKGSAFGTIRQPLADLGGLLGQLARAQS